MKNQIISLGEKNQKSFGFDDEKLIVSSKRHKSFESLEDASLNSGLLESVKTIQVNSIKEVKYNQKEDSFKVGYEKEDGKLKFESIVLEDVERRASIVDEIASMKNFTQATAEESKTKPLLTNIAALAFIGFLTWALRGMAIDAENGEHYVATGRRSGLKQLVANLVEYLGPTITTVIGVLVFLFVAFLTYKRFSAPASDISYS